ncbi:ParB/RepB/Spo0J family partition protein [Thermobifida halotolerans]|uniref:ParB/RepB/Spo0J family partition protein n=1 Tax=Thermobifida halotolerans TaxID=483545 RepID=UPI0022773457|nr:ParB/RepB/Spo0J family partition protein [Thermobifida halotolerans]
MHGRGPGESTAPTELADLISSIASVGVLQPVLAEETTSPDDAPALRLVAGERRLRACRWSAVNLPDNSHVSSFRNCPAVGRPCLGHLFDRSVNCCAKQLLDQRDFSQEFAQGTHRI